MRGLVAGLALTVAAAACSSPEEHITRAEIADEATAEYGKDVALYEGAFTLYEKQVGSDCMRAIIQVATTDLADDLSRGQGPDLINDETAAAMVADDCPTIPGRDDRTGLYHGIRHGVGEKLAHLLATSQYVADGEVSNEDLRTYEQEVLEDRTAYYRGLGYEIED